MLGGLTVLLLTAVASFAMDGLGFDPRANREAQRPIDLGLEADLQRRFANRNRSDQLR